MLIPCKAGRSASHVQRVVNGRNAIEVRILLFVILALTCSLTQVVRAEKPLTIKEARVPITGFDVNRPDPFPGLGKFGWPGNVQRLPDGELLMVHSAGYYHVSFAEPRLIEANTRKRWLSRGWPLDFPAPTGGRSMMTRSSDGGRTWSKPQTIVDLPLDDGPYGLLRCNDGTLLCFINVQASWYGFEEAPEEFRDDIGGLNTRQCVVRSTDDGATWSEPIWLNSPGRFYERSHAQPIQLAGGGILWPTYFDDGQGGKLKGAIHRSDDQGQTWRHVGTIARSDENIDEPALAPLPDGRLFLVSRPDGVYYYSEDEGVTWEKEDKLVTEGRFKAPRLFVLDDGTIVCVCTYQNLQVFLGLDGGRTWKGPFDLDPECYGYPGGLQLADRSILVTYCSSGGAPNRLYGVRFAVNENRDGIALLPLGEK